MLGRTEVWRSTVAEHGYRSPKSWQRECCGGTVWHAALWAGAAGPPLPLPSAPPAPRCVEPRPAEGRERSRLKLTTFFFFFFFDVVIFNLAHCSGWQVCQKARGLLGQMRQWEKCLRNTPWPGQSWQGCASSWVTLPSYHTGVKLPLSVGICGFETGQHLIVLIGKFYLIDCMLCRSCYWFSRVYPFEALC